MHFDHLLRYVPYGHYLKMYTNVRSDPLPLKKLDLEKLYIWRRLRWEHFDELRVVNYVE